MRPESGLGSKSVRFLRPAREKDVAQIAPSAPAADYNLMMLLHARHSPSRSKHVRKFHAELESSPPSCFNLIAQTSRSLYFRRPRLFADFRQCAHPVTKGHGALRAFRQFSHMFGTLVHCFQKRRQTSAKVHSIRCSQASSFLKSAWLKPKRTFGCCPLSISFAASDAKQQIGKSEAVGSGHLFSFEGQLAQNHLVHFAFQNLGQEDRRIIAFCKRRTTSLHN